MRWIEPNWRCPANIHAATTLRSGGVSSGDFSSLNLANNIGDSDQNVCTNRQIVRQMLELPAAPVWLQQTHSTTVVRIGADSNTCCADASFTSQPGVVCAILTADCLPLLLASSDGKTVAAIHAGWRGLVAGIISNTVAALPCRDVVAWLGPAIGACNFAIGLEVRQQFTNKSSSYQSAFCNKNGQWFGDIYQLARIELAALGIHRVYGGDFCTVSDPRFYSYRSSRTTGRMATLIWRS